MFSTFAALISRGSFSQVLSRFVKYAFFLVFNLQAIPSVFPASGWSKTGKIVSYWIVLVWTDVINLKHFLNKAKAVEERGCQWTQTNEFTKFKTKHNWNKKKSWWGWLLLYGVFELFVLFVCVCVVCVVCLFVCSCCVVCLFVCSCWFGIRRCAIRNCSCVVVRLDWFGIKLGI